MTTTHTEFIQVPAITLPSGITVPAFSVGKYLASHGAGSTIKINAEDAPWVNINFHDAIQACETSELKLLTESQALAIAHDIAQQDINWSGGKVGEGKVYQGIHKGTVKAAQPGGYESSDPEERRWHQLSNGERIYDFAGNAFTWIFDDVQGDDKGLMTIIKSDSPSFTTAPYASLKNGMGWRPNGECGWSGNALIRGGYWGSYDNAGVFRLSYGWPGGGGGGVGFRCTK